MCRFDVFSERLVDKYIMENSLRFCGVKDEEEKISFGLWVALFVLAASFCLFLLILILNMLKHLRILKKNISTRVLMNHDHFTVENDKSILEATLFH